MLSREKGEADLAGSERDVWMGDARREIDRWWCEGVVRWNLDAKVPEPAC